MLRIKVKGVESWDYDKEEFVKPTFDEATLVLEHSLISLSKWESKWKKPFLTDRKNAHTEEETLDYIRCMTVNSNVDPNVYKYLTNENIKEIEDYVSDPMTATTINNRDPNAVAGRGKREIITSEIIYYWMFTFNVPIVCEQWHLNRLLTLINVISIESAPKKKMSRRQLAAQNKLLNQKRRAMLGTKG